MTDAIDDDPLEAELRAIRPPGVSAMTIERIGNRLERMDLAARSGRRVRPALVAAVAVAAVAACIVIGLMVRRPDDRTPRPVVVERQPPQVVATDQGWLARAPTALSYRRALSSSSSPAELEALLDAQAAAFGATATATATDRGDVFARPRVALDPGMF
jgi:hypothetical protein